MRYEDYCQQEHCVCKTVHKIVQAQDKVSERQNHRCQTSCERSIKQLTSPFKKHQKNSTIPFILYCKQSCKPFIADGIFKRPIKGFPEEAFYDCLETPILRAKHFVKNTSCCVLVELLQPVNANGVPVGKSGEKLCDFFSSKGPYKTIHFRKTGICLTLDLNDFSSIACLDPIHPMPIYPYEDSSCHHDQACCCRSCDG